MKKYTEKSDTEFEFNPNECCYVYIQGYEKNKELYYDMIWCHSLKKIN